MLLLELCGMWLKVVKCGRCLGSRMRRCVEMVYWCHEVLTFLSCHLIEYICDQLSVIRLVILILSLTQVKKERIKFVS